VLLLLLLDSGGIVIDLDWLLVEAGVFVELLLVILLAYHNWWILPLGLVYSKFIEDFAVSGLG
jgi:hypothetical protein